MWHETCRRAEKKGERMVEWNEEMGRVVAEMRRAFEEWLQGSDRVTYCRYRAQRLVVKLAVQASKRMADRRWGEIGE